MMPLARIYGFFVLLTASCCFLPGSGLADETDQAVPATGNWLERTTRRYLGNSAIDDVELDGGAEEIVGAYLPYLGRTITVVIVSQVTDFSRELAAEAKFSRRALTALTKPFQDYTREWVIRDYLLFATGDQVIPYDLADTERMLRDLPFIDDVRLHVLPLQGETDAVAIVVETRDRWPFGVSAIVHTQDRWEMRLYSESLGGTGTRFSNTVLRNNNSEQRPWGYRGVLAKNNINGSFINGELLFEDSYKRLRRRTAVARPLLHPGLRVIGGGAMEYVQHFEGDRLPNTYSLADAWVGYARRLYDYRTETSSTRRVLIPALDWRQRDYRERSVVTPDSNRGQHNTESLLAGLTYEQVRSYKTSYLFKEGEIEDISGGLVVKVSAGRQWREFENRTALFWDSAWLEVRESGSILNLGFSVGGFLQENVFEDGIMDFHGRYYSRLLGGEDFRQRIYLGLDYTLGIGRHPYDKLNLGDRSGLRGMANNQVYGNQRLVFQAWDRMFTPWTLWGFRLSFLVFGDVGVIGDEDASSLWQEKFYTSGGVGVRVRNPALVLPTFELVVSLVQKVDENGVAFSVKIGNAGAPEIKYPSSRPGTVAYN